MVSTDAPSSAPTTKQQMTKSWEPHDGKPMQSGRTRKAAKRLPLWKRIRRAIKDIRETGAVYIALDAHGVGREILDDLAAQNHPIAQRFRQAHAAWTLETVKDLRALGLGTASRARARGYPNAIQWLLEQHAPRDYHERRQPNGADSAAVQVLQELRGAIQDARGTGASEGSAGARADTRTRELPAARVVDNPSEPGENSGEHGQPVESGENDAEG